jgi:hypothetical protein
MFAITVLCGVASLFKASHSRSLSRQADLTLTDDGVLVPKLKSDFKKGNTSAQWAVGYPKKWGSEDFHFQFDVPEPDDIFRGVVTEDEKYLAMFNGSHARFVDLDQNATVSTLGLGIPEGSYATGLWLRSIPQGGYHILTDVAPGKYDSPSMVSRIRVSSDLRPTGEPTLFQGGGIGDFDKTGRMATTHGFIYDLNSSDGAQVTLKNASSITGMSFSGNGQYISTVGWQDKSADLYNATTGEKILQFPATNAQNWLTKFSPDNKHIVISLGTGYLQIYSVANLTASPIVLGKFNDWIRSIEWSPDGMYLAAGDAGRMQLWKFPEVEIVQTWEVDGGNRELYGLLWLDDGKKVSWNYREGRYMYDFEKNLKWWWNVGVYDHSWGTNVVSILKRKGYVATSNGDSLVRFWKLEERS